MHLAAIQPTKAEKRMIQKALKLYGGDNPPAEEVFGHLHETDPVRWHQLVSAVTLIAIAEAKMGTRTV
jgi:hypothetical protein